MSEAQEQAAVFQWAELMKKRYPPLELLHHIPNGGSRHPAEAANLKRQGLKRGVPDIALPYPCGDQHGLYVELKHGRNRPTPEQKRWLEKLSELGYATAVCYSAEEAINVITKYLEGHRID